MKIRTSVWLMLIGLSMAFVPSGAPFQAQDANPSQEGYSHVRIVRLNFAEGTVAVQKRGLQDWSSAPTNTPMEEGFKLSTAEQSFAEVEFENTSSARLGQLTLIDFDQLALAPSGNKVNHITLEQGYATFTVYPDGMQDFEVKAQDATISLAAGATTQFRVDIDSGAVRVEVFKGAVSVSSAEGQQTLAKNSTVEIRPGVEQAFNVTEGIVKDAWDEWVAERDTVEQTVRNSPTPSVYSAQYGSTYYGWNELSYYGDWNYFPGYGYGWAPYMTGAGWSPYMVGQWCWYSGFGYTWISNEPWGWLPYHYGGWVYQAGFGWTWFPGTLSFWSPGVVNWSQGSGWVAWSPKPPHGRAGSTRCADGDFCGRIIVKPQTLQAGAQISRSNMLDSDVTGGKSVAHPDLVPTRNGMLPGTLFSSTTAFTGSPKALPGQAPTDGGVVVSGRNTVVVGDSSVARTTGTRPVVPLAGSRGVAVGESGVTFDPATGRFINSNNSRAAATGAPAEGTALSIDGGSHVAVPTSAAPRTNAEAPTQGSPWGVGRGSSAPDWHATHNQAPDSRPEPSSSSRSSFWGRQSSGGRQQGSNSGGYNGGSFGGGGRTGSFGTSSGSSSGGGGGVSRGGASSGGGSSPSTGGASRGGGATPHRQ